MHSDDVDGRELREEIAAALRAEADDLDAEGAHADAAEMRLFAEVWEAHGMPDTWPGKHMIRH